MLTGIVLINLLIPFEFAFCAYLYKLCSLMMFGKQQRRLDYERGNIQCRLGFDRKQIFIMSFIGNDFILMSLANYYNTTNENLFLA